MLYENVSAISTANGTGGVAIIRISGESPLKVASLMFKPSGKIKVEDFIPNYMYTGKILCDGFSDFGMCVYFKAPKSFTGEDVVEFHCHGGVQIARGVLKRTYELGCKPASRGEFTKRAFLNGKLSLSSAEGMIDMINAESFAEVRAGSLLYQEKLTEKVRDVQSVLTDLMANISADIDYPEEDIERDELSNVKETVEGVLADVVNLCKEYAVGKKIKDGVIVAICGKPNTGKSSLLNALVGYDKAIVSPVAGTTRDAVEGIIELDGVKFNLIDTAGIREKADEIESIGIDRARKILTSADIVIFVTEDGEGREVLDGVENANVITVFNKCDVREPNGKYDVVLSARTGKNVDALKSELLKRSVGTGSLEGAYVIEERHYLALKRARNSLENAKNSIGCVPLDLVSIDIKEAWQTLGEITGETANEEIINTVFAKFCVGK